EARCRMTDRLQYFCLFVEDEDSDFFVFSRAFARALNSKPLILHRENDGSTAMELPSPKLPPPAAHRFRFENAEDGRLRIAGLGSPSDPVEPSSVRDAFEFGIRPSHFHGQEIGRRRVPAGVTSRNS